MKRREDFEPTEYYQESADDDYEDLLIKDKIKLFFLTFSRQSGMYKIIWIIRICAWIIILAIACYGVFTKIVDVFH